MNSAVLLEMSRTKLKAKSKRGTWQVTLHDDSVNTFEHVINCLVDICAHNEFQAHQCALIVHNRKRCVIYKDNWAGCETVKQLLRSEGLTVTVEKYEKNI
jgi:ATP-dependent Clp protease adaptor protein ClpS